MFEGVGAGGVGGGGGWRSLRGWGLEERWVFEGVGAGGV